MKDTISDSTTILSRTQSIFGQVLRLFSRILSMLLVGCVLTVFVELVGVTFFWQDEGVEKSINMVIAEMGHLGSIVERSPMLSGLDVWVVSYLSTFKAFVVSVGLGDSVVAGNILFYFEVILNMVMVFCLKVAVMVFSFPVYLFCGFIGVTRGLVNRELRKWGGGRESSGQFHLWLNMVPVGFVSSWFIYLSWPWTINPNIVVLPFALFFGYMLMLSAYRVKKYI